MDQTYIHLWITHLPIVGSILGAIVLAHALWTKSVQTTIAAYNLLIISSIGAGIAYLTGEAAEETVEHIAGISESVIEQHEDFAIFALVSLMILGLASIVGLFVTLKKYAIIRTFAFITFFISLISFGFVARTGYLGGQIRHTEINDNSSIDTMDEEMEEEEEEEESEEED